MNKRKQKKYVQETLRITKKNIKWIKKLRKLGMGDGEIARNLDIPEDHMIFQDPTIR